MTDRPEGIPESEADRPAREFRRYVTGGVLSLALTLAAFGAVALRLVAGQGALVVLGLLALAQIVVQFRYFLHIDLQKSHRDDLQLILFTALIVGLMVGGTIWILFDQHTRM
ncbi:cytochrome-c oxidase [Mesobaculum littorinae]|uniref:Cytochrome bo(3) ubiquinol oxidase subunit 4 n=1 Tax=Mesobaculum littorinae TaxID=2486419 RepID=A0A438ADL0_9RHOB|nr:cytochrome C oxidase subunit IV family protein [Mesobaculum littorinae]RVV96790.1 cytochrome-c oxidase [Mesobaculum littorinae]